MQGAWRALGWALVKSRKKNLKSANSRPHRPTATLPGNRSVLTLRSSRADFGRCVATCHRIVARRCRAGEVAPVHMALRAALQRNPRLARDDRDALRLDTERIVPPRRRGKREVRGAPARRHAGGCSWARSVERLDRTSRENARHCDAAPLGELCPCVVWPRWRGFHWRRQEWQSDGGGLRSLLPCSDLAVGGHAGTQDCLG